MDKRPTRISVERILSWVTAALALVTLVWPDWIELISGEDPDEGSGTLEIAIVVAMAAICVGLRIDVHRLQRRAASPEAG